MTALKIAATLEFETIECCECGTLFAITGDLERARRIDHVIFYCPRGHGQHYAGISAVEKAKAEAVAERQRHADTLARLNEATAEAERLKKQARRVRRGTCPCCNRNFVKLAAHMQTKHPDYAKR